MTGLGGTTELLAALGGGLTAGQLSQLAVVLQTLEADPHAPTAVRTAKQAVDVHVADSLAALELDAVRAAHRIADLGSGVGFPGLALAVALPAAEIRLVESQRRRCEFLERVCARAEIGNARVVCARAEEWREGLVGNDAVVARALAAPSVVLEYAAPLLRLGGTVVDWRGKRVPQQEDAAMRAADELGLRREEVRRVEPFSGAQERYLHLHLKVRDTPERFPRRAGMARKRPLGEPPRDFPHEVDGPN
jgi:16S rRNA (guanine527-N7)-methyltransferase